MGVVGVTRTSQLWRADKDIAEETDCRERRRWTMDVVLAGHRVRHPDCGMLDPSRCFQDADVGEEPADNGCKPACARGALVGANRWQW